MRRAGLAVFVALAVLFAAEPSAGKHGGDREPGSVRDTDHSGRSGAGRGEQDRDRSGSGREGGGGGQEGREREDSPGAQDSSGPGSGHDDTSDSDQREQGGEDGAPSNGNSGPGSSSSGKLQDGKSMRVVRDARGDEHFEREVLLALPDNVDIQDIVRPGYTILAQDRLPAAGLILLRLRAPTARLGTADALSRDYPGAIASLNHVYRADGGAVSRRASQRTIARRPGHVVVGLIDGQVESTHPLLRNLTIVASPFEDGVPAKTDHATALASIFASHQDTVALYAASVFVDTGGDSYGASAASIVRALDWLSGQDVKVINISLSGPPNPILEGMVKRLAQRGHIVVAAVGNDGPSRPVRYPAAYPEAVGVTAVDLERSVYRYANRGPEVDVAALGVGVEAATTGGAVKIVSGTSYAAPIVALVLANQGDGNSSNAIEDLRRAAVDLGAPGRDPVFGWGMVGSNSKNDALARTR